MSDHLTGSATDRIFLAGAAGTGKTTLAAQHVIDLSTVHTTPDRVLVLVPQIGFARPYQLKLHQADLNGGAVEIQTIAGIARRAIETYWPLVSEQAGFGDPAHEPTFLNVETAQYLMARLVTPSIEEGLFDSVTIPRPRLISQVIDNLNRAALLRFPLDDVAQRLTSAWGTERDSTRPEVYQAAIDLAKAFRSMCLARNWLDFSLMIEIYQSILLNDERYADSLRAHYDFLVADNIEEMNAASHDLIRWLMPSLQGALLVYDIDAEFRVFLGADLDRAFDLSRLCNVQQVLTESLVNSPALGALVGEFAQVQPDPYTLPDDPYPYAASPLAAFTFKTHRYYPQMIAWAAEQISDLVNRQGVPAREIVVVAPFLNDSLRFTLVYQLEQAGIPVVSHRPSRSVRDEPATRTLITLAMLADPGPTKPPLYDVADALAQSIAGLDPIRARLLAQAVYQAETGTLDAFGQITRDDLRTRITYTLGERYDQLRAWLLDYRVQVEQAGVMPLDHCFVRMFGEILSQPGFGFHENLEAGRVIAQLIEAAQTFRRTLYGDSAEDWSAASVEYLGLINQRMIAAFYAPNWREESADAVLLAPAYTYLLRNRFVDYQFWLDAGSDAWSRRIQQPLTHPHVLSGNFDATSIWTDGMEQDEELRALRHITLGLARRCRQQIFIGIADLGESGYEMRGRLLNVLQEILRRNPAEEPTENPTEEPAS